MFRKEAALLTACLCSAVAMAQDATSTVDALPAHTASSPEQSLALPPDAAVEGNSFAQLTAKWWQWAFSMPIAPFMDPDGRLCAFNQDGPVWFLAGTDGSYTVQRKCLIPTGKYVLLPIINMIYNNPQRKMKKWKPYSCPQLQSRAALNNDKLSSAVVMVDGVVIPDVVRYRVRSNGCFHLSLSPDANGKTTPISAADGYWLLLKPLSLGRHTIAVGANYGASGDGYATMQQNFEYVIDVGGRSELAASRRGVVPRDGGKQPRQPERKPKPSAGVASAYQYRPALTDLGNPSSVLQFDFDIAGRSGRGECIPKLDRRTRRSLRLGPSKRLMVIGKSTKKYSAVTA